MNQKKPILEKIDTGFESSILVKKHTEFKSNQSPFWHFHPELELVYVNKGQGKRHIGNHLSYFNNSQLLLIGSNLPHNGFTDRLTVKVKKRTTPGKEKRTFVFFEWTFQRHFHRSYTKV